MFMLTGKYFTSEGSLLITVYAKEKLKSKKRYLKHRERERDEREKRERQREGDKCLSE